MMVMNTYPRPKINIITNRPRICLINSQSGPRKVIIHIFHIFLNKGIMFLEHNLVDEFLIENELYYIKKIEDKEFCYIEIDTERTDVSSFYTYNENSDVECWRRFIYIGSSDDLHINRTNPDFILPVLDFIKSIK
jgi:hypothetical protein